MLKSLSKDLTVPYLGQSFRLVEPLIPFPNWKVEKGSVFSLTPGQAVSVHQRS